MPGVSSRPTHCHSSCVGRNVAPRIGLAAEADDAAGALRIDSPFHLSGPVEQIPYQYSTPQGACPLQLPGYSDQYPQLIHTTRRCLYTGLSTGRRRVVRKNTRPVRCGQEPGMLSRPLGCALAFQRLPLSLAYFVPRPAESTMKERWRYAGCSPGAATRVFHVKQLQSTRRSETRPAMGEDTRTGRTISEATCPQRCPHGYPQRYPQRHPQPLYLPNQDIRGGCKTTRRDTDPK